MLADRREQVVEASARWCSPVVRRELPSPARSESSVERKGMPSGRGEADLGLRADSNPTSTWSCRCSFSGEIFHNLATNLKLIQPRTPSVSAHPKLRPRGHPLSPQSSRPQLCAVVAYFTMRTVFTIPCCIVSCWSEQVDNGKLRLFDSFHQTD